MSKKEIIKDMIKSINHIFGLQKEKEAVMKEELDSVQSMIEELRRHQLNLIPCETDFEKDEIVINLKILRLIESQIQKQIELQSKLNHYYTTQLSNLYRTQFDRL